MSGFRHEPDILPDFLDRTRNRLTLSVLSSRFLNVLRSGAASNSLPSARAEVQYRDANDRR
jgi:hypothetical protein